MVWLQASFFIAYVVTSGWTSTSSELFRVIPLFLSLIRRPFAGDPDDELEVPAMEYHKDIPRILFFGLLGITYFFLAPLILPFLLVYFCLGYIIFRNQVRRPFPFPLYSSTFQNLVAIFFRDSKRHYILSYVYSLNFRFAVYQCLWAKIRNCREVLAYCAQLNDIFFGAHARHCCGNLHFEEALSSIILSCSSPNPHSSIQRVLPKTLPAHFHCLLCRGTSRNHDNFTPFDSIFSLLISLHF